MKPHQHPFHSHGFDRAGILLSTICLIHCIALPVALPVLQAVGLRANIKILENEAFHLVFAILLLGIGGVAFVFGFLRHRAWLPLLLGALGTAFLFIGALNPMHLLSEREAHAFTVLGTFVLIFAHVKNRRARCDGATGLKSKTDTMASSPRT
jgi:hypothetical protein